MLDGYVPIGSSVADGLESLLHRYNNFGPDHRWLAAPLAALTRGLLVRHLRCLETRFGPLDFATHVPSWGGDRPFDPLPTAASLISDWPVPWIFNLMSKTREGRPARGVVDSSYFRFNASTRLPGLAILPVDDTWTSGASLVSTAKMLRAHGAARIVGLTVGRQLTEGFGSSDAVKAALRDMAFLPRICVICSWRATRR
ncbi:MULTISPECIES: phosphoribosyltransferase [unclassified Actinoplanes]|uniref:phosphoribosyltransferase n=1 Tax=unclassified Actinoplanes TaxID=2626549 RepID=UPI0005B95F5A|nr:MULTISPECIES: phosphoribosyltransferase [unclassified Actinoplanes]